MVQISQLPQHLRDRPPIQGLDTRITVTQDEATSVGLYLPKDIFYDFKTLASVQGQGAYVSLDNIPFMEILLNMRVGVVLPLPAQLAMTTTQVRKQGYKLIVAPGRDAKVPSKTEVWMQFGDSLGRLNVGGMFGCELGVTS